MTWAGHPQGCPACDKESDWQAGLDQRTVGPELQITQQISIELDYLPLRKAFRMVAMPSKTSWWPVSTKNIFVGSQGRRRDFRDNAMTTFCLRNVTPCCKSSRDQLRTLGTVVPTSTFITSTDF
jgi:hypothetical protein